MIQRVKITDLKPGMFVVDPDKGKRLTPPVYTVEGYILSGNEGEKLAQRGFRYAFVDEARYLMDMILSSSEADVEEELLPPQIVDFAAEQARAAALHAQGVAAAQALTEQIRCNRDVNLRPLMPLFTDISASIERNPNALACLGRLRTKDDYTFTHCVNVATYTAMLGRQLGVKRNRLPELVMAGFFHDLGKLMMPEELLNHPGKYSKDQFEAMQNHCILGQAYINQHPGLPASAAAAALEHHERYQGGGYPFGLVGEDICFAARVVAVADVYDALSSRRAYKEPLHPAETLRIMYKDRERDFTPGFMDALVSTIGVYPLGCFVRLSNRYWAVVTEFNPELPLRPKVVQLADSFGKALPRPCSVDLSVHLSLSIAQPVNGLPCPIDVEEALRFARY